MGPDGRRRQRFRYWRNAGGCLRAVVASCRVQWRSAAASAGVLRRFQRGRNRPRRARGGRLMVKVLAEDFDGLLGCRRVPCSKALVHSFREMVQSLPLLGGSSQCFPASWLSCTCPPGRGKHQRSMSAFWRAVVPSSANAAGVRAEVI